MDSPVGFRFQPTPQELINHFLKKKRLDPASTDYFIKDLNIYEHRPCELPGLSVQSDEEEVWYFFCVLDQKYANSDRTKRTAKGGSWKKTGKDLIVKTKRTNKQIGFRKTLVFYKGSNCKKENKTNWVMHEYHAYREDHRNKEPVFRREVVVCRIERKPDKNHEPSSALDEGQPNNLDYDSGSNVTEDIFPKEEPDQVLQNLHLPSSSSNNYTENTDLMEVESHPVPMHYLPDVTKNQLESQPLPKQQKSLNDLVTEKNTSSEEESQLPPNQHMSSNGEDHVANDINDIFLGLEPLDPAGWYNPLTE